ncbi:hypothetical protein [Polluticoccus soli]|uniref:hypothetical protein n=1 Tax=Polluticoccus soli TaxID=3034150 RepID=UPI0023E21184|nr:hypothetical protein [Flavipsychrobacter sp. JY13-12]
MAAAVAIVALVVIRVITVIVASVRKKKYLNAVITTAILLGFFAFVYFVAIKMIDLADKVLHEGLR